MKKPYLLTLPLFAFLIAGCSKQPEPETTPTPSSTPTLSERADTAYEKSKEVIVDAKEAVAAKIKEWDLTPADIKSDLERSGRVMREKTLAAGEKTGGVLDNARIATVINGKYIADKDLSSLKINVDASNGVVTLRGTTNSYNLIGRAITLALDTEGVSQVVSRLVVENATDEPSNTSGLPRGM